MNNNTLQDLLMLVQKGQIAISAAMERLRTLPFEDLDFAKIDHHRLLRSGHCWKGLSPYQAESSYSDILTIYAKKVLTFSPTMKK